MSHAGQVFGMTFLEKIEKKRLLPLLKSFIMVIPKVSTNTGPPRLVFPIPALKQSQEHSAFFQTNPSEW